MRSGFLITLLTLVVIGAALALFVHDQPLPLAEPATIPNSATTTTPAPPDPTPIIPLETKIGQLFMIGHWADTPVASTTELIRTYQFGGVVIMSAPEDPTAIKGWVEEWNNVSSSTLLIAIDQEGGVVSRLRGPEFSTTSQRSITDAKTAYAVGKTRGTELANLTINVNLAPVLETASNTDSFLYKRVFPSPADNPTLAAAMLQGMAESGVFGVVKHFPGHPDTPEDSHETLPSIDISLAELSDFTSAWKTLITNNPPPAIMTAHVSFPQIDERPATLSTFFLRDYLRDTLDYQGVIITDDLIMQAVATSSDSSAAAVQAFTAGADLLLFAAEPLEAIPAITTLTNAVADGMISADLVDQSYTRIVQLKREIGAAW